MNVKEELEDRISQEVHELKAEKTSFHIKQESDLNLHVNGCEHNVHELKAEKTSFHIKQESELNLHVNGCEHNFVGASWSTDFIKEDPELILEADDPENIVVDSTRYASNSTRLTQTICESSAISLEETVCEEQIHERLEIRTEKSMHCTTIGYHTKGLLSQEDSSLSNIVKCSSRDKEVHKFKCSSCLLRFSSKYRLIMHVFNHIDGVQPPKYVCKTCGEVFQSNFSLNKHSELSEGAKVLPAGNNEKFNCSSDYKSVAVWKDAKNLRITKKIKKPSSSKDRLKTSKKSFTDKNKTHAMKNVEEESDRNNNYRTVSTTCNVKDRADKLGANRPHKCSVCEKSFTQLSHLKSHILIHTGKRTHKCEICDKSFIHMHHLKTHALIHTGNRPYKCDICGTSFFKLSNVKRHLVVHTGKRLHECDICGKSFTQLGTLKRHGLTHTGKRPHKCDICGKSFTQLSSVKRHVLIHTGKGTHKCDTCDKSFTRLGNLKKHALLHTGKKPLKYDT